MKNVAFIVLLIAISHLAYSQDQRKADSLIEYAKNVPDSLKAKTYNDICWEMRVLNPHKSLEYGRMAEEIAKNTDDHKELCRSYSYLGVCERNLGNFTRAMYYFNLDIEESKKNNFKDEIVWSYNNVAYMFNKQENYESAIEYLKTAESYAMELKDSFMLGYVYTNLGISYTGKGDYRSASDILSKALYIRTTVNPKPLQIGVALKSLGDLYYCRNMYDSSKYYLYKTLQTLDKDIDMTSDTYYRLASIYLRTKNYDSALYCGEKALLKGKLKGTKYMIMNAYGILGDIYFEQGEYIKASENYSNQITYNDSIFDDDLTVKILDIQFTAEQNQKQAEIDKVNENKRFQTNVIYILGGTLLIGISFVLILIRNSKNTRDINKVLKEQQKQIKDSIGYAQKIQEAIMPSKDKILSTISDKFIIYKPREIVSGDFYWASEDDDYQMIAVADCTGHGVPGACMGMIGTSIMHEITNGVKNPSDILEIMRDQVKKLLHQTRTSANENDDGMDIGIAVIEKQNLTLRYSGAFIPLWYIRDGEIKHLKATKNPVGGYVKEVSFKTLELKLQPGDCIYLTTDGYCSQFGGENNSKLSLSTFKELLVKIHKLKMEEQSEIIMKTFNEWRGNCEQVDDVCMVGFRIQEIKS